MLESPYTVRNLTSLIQKKRGRKNSSNSKLEALETARKILEKIESNTIFKHAFKELKINNKKVISYLTEDAETASRLAIRNLKLNARLKQSNRSDIIAALIPSLQDGTPYTIHRFDIVKFYESIDRNKLLSILEDQALCSFKTLKLIRHLFDNLTNLGIQGLPRGLDISAYLSEIYMQQFDNKTKRLSHVNFYARFVDDILILTNTSSTDDTSIQIRNILSTELKLHKKTKSNLIHIEKIQTTSKLNTKDFDYLGYKFRVHNTYISNSETIYRNKRIVDIDLSDNKTKKIKSRIFSSLLSYCSSSKKPYDYELLKKRIKTLTGNYEIDSKNGTCIKTGIYYNYHHKTKIQNCNLAELDNSFKRALFSKSHHLNTSICSALNISQRRSLANFSFLRGFEKVTYYSFSYKELAEIRQHWN